MKLLENLKFKDLHYFKVLLYSSTVYYYISLLPLYKEIWVEYGLTEGCSQNFPFFSFMPCVFGHYYFVILYALLLISFLLFLIRDNIIIRLIFAYSLNSLYYSNFYIADGSNNLFSILSIFLIAAPSSRNIEKLEAKVFSNLSFALITFQICLLYFISGTFKAFSQLWPKGVGLYYSLINPDYSHPIIFENISNIPLIVLVLTNYIIIAFQVSFPFLVFNERTRKFALVVGFLFHIFIAVFMGLWFFSLSMIFAHTIFYKNKELKYIKTKVLNLIPRKLRFANG